MREGGLEETIRAAGGVGSLAIPPGACLPGAAQRHEMSPDDAAGGPARDAAFPFKAEPSLMTDDHQPGEVDEVDLLRAHEYGLLAVLFGRAPGAEILARVAELRGDASPLGLAHIHLAELAARADADAVSREYFDLFVGIGRGELLPYGSYYMTGFLHERPLARVREDLARLGIERTEAQREPEDHIAILCDVMAGLASGRLGRDLAAERAFFERHLKPWAARFFADCETTPRAGFYKAAGAVGRMFMEIEAEAFAMAI